MLTDYDHFVLGVGNSNHPANQPTLVDDELENLTDLEFAQYELRQAEKEIKRLKGVIADIYNICKPADDDGLAVMVCKRIEKAMI